MSSIRTRVLAVVIGLLLLSSSAAVLLLRTSLLDDLDSEVEPAGSGSSCTTPATSCGRP